MVVTAVWTQCL